MTMTLSAPVSSPLMTANVAWDAAWLAHTHPALFALDEPSGRSGAVFFRDMVAIAELDDPAIELDTDGEGVVLRVFGVGAQVTRAIPAV